MENQEFGIQQKFIDSQSYKLVAEKAKRRNVLYDNYLQVLEKIYQHYREFFEQTGEILKSKQHEKSMYIKQFKSFLRAITDILRETSIFQIDCITQARVNKDQTIDEVTTMIVDKISAFSEPQSQFLSQLNKLNELKKQTDKLYSNLKIQSTQAISFYSNKLMISKKKAISESINKITDEQTKLKKSLESITFNSYDFEKYLQQFRKKLFKNKYNMLKKMFDTSKHSRNSLTEILLFLAGCTHQKLQHYMVLVKHPKSDDLSLSQSKGKKKGNEDYDQIVSSMISSIQEYNVILEDLEKIIKILDEAFKRLGRKVREDIDSNNKVLLEYMNNLYEIGENPSSEVTRTFDLFSYFTQKFTSISDKLLLSWTKLNILKTNVKKHSDVTLSLMRYNDGKPKNYVADKQSQVDRMYDQISYDYLIDIITEVYIAFKDTLGDLKNYFNQHSYKKKKNTIQDSMELSHIEESYQIPQKKPCKNQIWLWKDWRDKTSFTFQTSGQFLKNMQKLLNQIKEEEEKKEIEKFQCTLSSKKDIKGVLKVCDGCLQFISISQSSPNTSLIIPFNDIKEVETRVKIFEKILNVQTQKGDIVFNNFLDIEKSKESINQRIESGGSQKQVMQKRATVKLSPQQLEIIEKRKKEIEKERTDVSQLNKLTDAFIPGVKIEEVYDTIYSDKPFTMRGKTQECFFAYTMKKAKNYNLTTKPYDKPGPQFYTLEKGVSFANCPLFSVRYLQYDHDLPKMPFMPKNCHCEQKNHLYWISNEEFDYYTISTTSGAPYADCFFVKIHHSIKARDGGVQIKIYGAINFIKDTRMKSILKSQAQKQMGEGAQFNLDEMVKVLKMMAGDSSKESSVGESKLLESTVAPGVGGSSTQTNEIDKLKHQNKLLIICLVGVFVVNVLMKIFMN